MQDTPLTFQCTGAELFCLSALLGGEYLVGVADPFTGWLTEEIQEAFVQIQANLITRRYLIPQDAGELQMHPAIAALVATMIQPKVIILVTLTGSTGASVQQNFYQREPLFVAAITEDGEAYTLTTIDSAEAIYQSICALWQLAQQPAAPGDCFTISESVLRKVQPLATEEKQVLLQREGIVTETARAFAETLATARHNGAIVALRHDETGWHPAGLGVLEGQNGLWQLRSLERQGEPWVEARPCDAPNLAATLRHLLARFVTFENDGLSS